jgi:hypothetical protein
MKKFDPVSERERLTKRYSLMSDLELQAVGQEPESLTEGAHQALEAEMNKRGLEWTIDEDVLTGNPVVLRTYRDMPAAYVDKSVLDAAGIRCFLQDANIVRMDWLWSNAMGGIKLVVNEADAEDAKSILDANPADPLEEPEN